MVLIDALAAPRRHEPDEVALYAYKLVCMRRPELSDGELLRRVALSGAVSRGVVGELLLNLALTGFDARALLPDASFWNPHWEYHRTQVDDITAAVHRFGGLPLEQVDPTPGLAAAIEALAAAARRRDELLESAAVRNHQTLTELVEGYWRLPAHLPRLQKAAHALAHSEALFEERRAGMRERK
jgi:hypothetical protein